MILFVVLLNNETITFDVEQSDTIDNVKSKIEDKIGKIENQKIIFEGKQLENGRTLADYNVQGGTTVFLSLKLKGAVILYGKDDVNGYIKNFGERMKEYANVMEKKKLSVEYYMGQSGHEEIKAELKRYTIWVYVDDNLDKEWKNNLSELDKVSLNIAYPPAKIIDEYDPELGMTGLYYGGRQVMDNHNFPAENINYGICGPISGPNGPACRVLRTDKMDELNKKGKFQGFSGMIYGGGKMKKRGEGHDEVGGPDNGSPCDSCLKEIFNKNEIKQFKSRFKEIRNNKLKGNIF